MRTRAFGPMVLGAALLLLSAPAEARAQESGVQLWGRTCSRCHNARPVGERTDREWAIIVNHMRARANLMKSDARAILDFLQAANGPETVAAAPSGQTEAAATEMSGTAANEPGWTAEQLRALIAYFQRLALMESPLSWGTPR